MEAAAAAAPAALGAALPALEDWFWFLNFDGSLQRLKEVQTVHGLPSSPITIPGGNGELVFWNDIECQIRQAREGVWRVVGPLKHRRLWWEERTLRWGTGPNLRVS